MTQAERILAQVGKPAFVLWFDEEARQWDIGCPGGITEKRQKMRTGAKIPVTIKGDRGFFYFVSIGGCFYA